MKSIKSRLRQIIFALLGLRVEFVQVVENGIAVAKPIVIVPPL